MAEPMSQDVVQVVGIKPRIIYEGRKEYSYGGGNEYVAFLGVPYAARPDGLKRYQAPEPYTCDETPDQSPSVYKANVTWKRSVQFHRPFYAGSSDCLYLNIFIPKDPKEMDELLPVLVFIHGGGFAYGSNSAESYSPDFIIQHGVVFVTINYRLGLFGFLNMRSEMCPGNAGLKDQVRALEWIRDNIEGFGGDPKNVTISGCSAGATCVNMHLISPLSKDLFHKAIVQSGGIYSTWGFKGRQCHRKKMLFEDAEFRQLFLARLETKALQQYTNDLLDQDRWRRHPRSLSPLFGPTLEKFKENAFIGDDIEEMMKNVDHNIPVMAGIAKEEGIYQFYIDPHTKFADWVPVDRSFRQLLMDNFRWSSGTAGKLLHEIREKYFPKWFKMSTIEIDRCFAKFVRDIFFRRFYDNFRFGPEKNIHKNLYVYRFDHVSEISTVRHNNMSQFYGATHGDELNYLYCSTFLKSRWGQYIYEGPNQNKEIKEVMNHMCSLWANFCKNGIPHSDFDASKTVWRRHTEEEPCFLSISKNLTLIEEPLFKEDWGWLNARVNPQPIVDSPTSTPE